MGFGPHRTQLRYDDGGGESRYQSPCDASCDDDHCCRAEELAERHGAEGSIGARRGGRSWRHDGSGDRGGCRPRRQGAHYWSRAAAGRGVTTAAGTVAGAGQGARGSRRRPGVATGRGVTTGSGDRGRRSGQGAKGLSTAPGVAAGRGVTTAAGTAAGAGPGAKGLTTPRPAQPVTATRTALCSARPEGRHGNGNAYGRGVVYGTLGKRLLASASGGGAQQRRVERRRHRRGERWSRRHRGPRSRLPGPAMATARARAVADTSGVLAAVTRIPGTARSLW